MSGALTLSSRVAPERFIVRPFLRIMDYFYITCHYTPVLNDSDLEVPFLYCATIGLDNPLTHVHSGYRLADAVTTVFVKGVPGEGAGVLPKMVPIYVDMVDI
jgi:hypothetical protein